MKQISKRASLMLISLLTIWYANAETIVTVDGLQYSLSGAYASVYGVDKGNNTEKINVPATIVYEGLTYTVNEISKEAFYNAKYVKEVELPNTIRTIGPGAFIFVFRDL